MVAISHTSNTRDSIIYGINNVNIILTPPLLMGARFFPRPFQQDVKSWFCIELLPFGGFGNIAFFAK